jgi:hypothetical protein
MITKSSQYYTPWVPCLSSWTNLLTGEFYKASRWKAVLILGPRRLPRVLTACTEAFLGHATFSIGCGFVLLWSTL